MHHQNLDNEQSSSDGVLGELLLLLTLKWANLNKFCSIFLNNISILDSNRSKIYLKCSSIASYLHMSAYHACLHKSIIENSLDRHKANWIKTRKPLDSIPSWKLELQTLVYFGIWQVALVLESREGVLKTSRVGGGGWGGNFPLPQAYADTAPLFECRALGVILLILLHLVTGFLLILNSQLSHIAYMKLRTTGAAGWRQHLMIKISIQRGMSECHCHTGGSSLYQ